MDLGYWTCLCLALLLTGCGKSPTPTPTPNAESALRTPHSAIIKFHWLGKQRLATEAKATNFMAIWNLPESARLEAQTLDKLATAPWRLSLTNSVVSNAPTALLRYLLDDLMQHEVYVEATKATNHSGELVIAIRLPTTRSALWETNLPQVLQSLSVPGSPLSDLSSQLTLSRAGDWTLLAFTPSLRPRDGQDAVRSTLLTDFCSRIAAAKNPFADFGTNSLMAVEMDLVLVNEFFGLLGELAPIVPQLSLTTTIDGDSIRTVGEALVANSIGSLSDWNLPTNSIHDPLIAFTAMRGLGAVGAKLQGPGALKGGAVPDQFFSWAVAGYPLQTYSAVPQFESTNLIRLLSVALQEKAISSGGRKIPGRFITATNHERIDLQGIPFMEPWLQKYEGANGEFLVGGLIPMMRTNRPIPNALIAQVVADPRLIYYDWEITGPRVEAWIYISQTLRLIFNRAQLPTDSAGLKWLQALMPRVGNSATAITLKSPQRITFVRTSTMGFTGLELHLLTDWLESPRFPLGLYSEQPQSNQSRPPMPGK